MGQTATKPRKTTLRTKTSRRSKTPMRLYVDVARELKNEIVSGAYPVGSQLPTEAELCKRFAVGRHTVREALRLLRDERLVSSRQGAGTVVVPLRPSDSLVLDAVSIDDLAAYAADMHAELNSAKMELVTGRLAARIGVASGDEWLTMRGVALLDGHELPVCGCEHYIHRDFAALGRLLPRHSGPIFLLIEALFAQSIIEIKQDIVATLISSALAPDLKVPAETPAIEVRRTFKTADGRIAQVTVHTHPAARFRHSMTMRRGKT
jgi:GntR family transcriptional regulator